MAKTIVCCLVGLLWGYGRDGIFIWAEIGAVIYTEGVHTSINNLVKPKLMRSNKTLSDPEYHDVDSSQSAPHSLTKGTCRQRRSGSAFLIRVMKYCIRCYDSLC